MTNFDFAGRVVVVTGAGRGLGRAYARLFGALGAKVVVNDLGGSHEGRGSDAAPAQQVAGEIVAAGGEAIADPHDVSTPEGGRRIIENAVDHFGKIDVLINNAGIQRWAGLPEIELENLEGLLNVHVVGSFNTIKAAWPHFMAQRYGRVVTTTSTAVHGMVRGLSYCAAKGGIIGMSRAVALEGEPHGIKVNMIAPAAITRIAGDEQPDSGGAHIEAVMTPEAVAPMVGYLAHERCPYNGEMFVAGAGHFARMFLGVTSGWAKGGGIASIDDIAANIGTIFDEATYRINRDTDDWMASFMSHVA